MAPLRLVGLVFVLFSSSFSPQVTTMHVNQVIRHQRQSGRYPSCTGSCLVRALCELLVMPRDAWADRRKVQGITGFDLDLGPDDAGLRKHWAFADKHFLVSEIAGFKVSRNEGDDRERGMGVAKDGERVALCCLPSHVATLLYRL
jgi:hypothetical protein